MNKYMKLLASTILAGLLFSACGGGGGDSTSDEGGIGYLIDSPIAGLDYSCGSKTSSTSSDGKFNCTNMPVVFKVGNYTVGCLSEITPDTKIYPQDLLGLERTNVTDSSLIELVQFFQALDDDGEIEDTITITNAMKEEFSDVYGYIKGCSGNSGEPGPGDPIPGDPNPGNPSNPDNPGSSEMTPSKAASEAGKALPSPEGAMKHLEKSMNGETIPDMSDTSEYIGTWIGNGWNWEVRFKHNSGDFASSMFGVDRSDIPFETEKTIMSLTVEQQNTFTFTVDEDGYIDGEGVIVYNLLPNICGVHALATQVNTSVNLMSKMADFFKTGSTIYKDTIGEFIVDNSAVDKETYTLVTDIYEKRKSPTEIMEAFQTYISKQSIQRDSSNPLTDFAKNYVTEMAKGLGKRAVTALESSNQSGDICLAAAGSAAYGGQSVGPKTLEEMLKNGQLAAAKQLAAGDFSIDLANIVLSIPGYTQIQYYYKGLENGPETRNFTFSGYINGSGEIYLENVDIDGDPLVVEYTVNWQTDKASFPTWSPFLDNHGLVQASNTPTVTYAYETVMEEQSYTDVTDGSKTKKVLVPVKKLVAQNINAVASMATFNEKGTNRVPSNSYQWHDYEYNWNAYRIGD